ncbi:MAG: transcription-repair coupling factor, partial [Deltaproteobacteria bacterium]|nr:transcription-repair coupling factor [Deltaproteobacteria bacterium]
MSNKNISAVSTPLEAPKGCGAKTLFYGLSGSSKAYVLASLYKTRKKPILAILPTDEEAEAFASELRFFLGNDHIQHFPSTETLPYDTQPIHPEIAALRLELLYKLAAGRTFITVTSAKNLKERLIPKDALLNAVQNLAVGVEYPREGLLLKLDANGYDRMSLVEERGEMSLRGCILDIFPPLYDKPLRIEFFADEIVSIRAFDPSTQRSAGELEGALIAPARESLLTSERRLLASEKLLDRADALSLERKEWEPLYASLKDHTPLPTPEKTLLPLFHKRLDTLFDYLNEETIVAAIEHRLLKKRLNELDDELGAIVQRLLEKKKFFVEPHGLFAQGDETIRRMNGFHVLELESLVTVEKQDKAFDVKANIGIRRELLAKKGEKLFSPFVETIRGWLDHGLSVYLTAHNRGQAERTRELIEPYGLNPAIAEGRDILDSPEGPLFKIVMGELHTGFVSQDLGVAIITEEEVFGERVKRRPLPAKKLEAFLTSLSDLNKNDPVVHTTHGIGRYMGLKRIAVDGIENDYIVIEYRDGDKLYLPVDKMELLTRYHGVEGRGFDLDKLGSAGWEKKKARVRKAVIEIAGELIKHYAARMASKGFAYSKGGHLFDEFESSFEYEPTADQSRAIKEVISDMESEQPMDRLICGDVGYGKTEVAMRAAFKAVLDSKQVAVLVPTTVLAEQHYLTFKNRFAPYPVEVQALSRFRDKKEQKEIIEKARSGEIDILIGTHRLLQKDVGFKDLGLVVIDEEHRFGVKHKERLVQLKSGVDVLTLTATPIPRTLQMAVSDLRGLSIISTPPENRLAIKTIVADLDETLLGDAIERELKRGGQVFFVHNRIETIGSVRDSLKRLVPHAKVATAHGQMTEHSLEETMLGFVEKRYDILLSTAIIESGLDIPNANTIIIDRAHMFGLSELHQLRGRIGRSKHRAYAYLICPEKENAPVHVHERMEIIQTLTDPGAGFRIAAHDLEIRGAGELLGASQSGHIAEVGFDTYAKLLEEAVSELKGEPAKEEPPAEVSLKASRYIPDDYIPDVRQRLGLYKRLSEISTEDESHELREELTDRYGALPELVLNLFSVAELKLLLRQLKAQELKQTGQRLHVAFAVDSVGASLARWIIK